MAFQFVAADFINTAADPSGTDISEWFDIDFNDFEVTLFDFTVPGLSGSLADLEPAGLIDLVDPLSGSYSIGDLTGNVDLFLDFPSLDLGAFQVFYGTEFSIEAPDEIVAGEDFSVTIGTQVKDGDKIATGETMQVDKGSAGLNLDIAMGASSVDFDGFFEIWGKPFVPYDKTVEFDGFSHEDFVLLEITPASASVEVGEFELFLELPKSGTGKEEQAGTGAINSLAPISVEANSDNKIAGINTNLFELIDFGPLKFLDALSEDEIKIPGTKWELEYTLFGIPIEVGIGVQQVMTFTPDLSTATVSLSSNDATGETGTVKSAGSSFDLTAAPDIGEGVTLGAELGLGGTLQVDYNLTLTGSIGYEALSLLLTKSGGKAEIGFPGFSDEWTLFNPSLGTLFSQTIDLAPGALTADFEIEIGAGEATNPGDGQLHAYTAGQKTLDQIAADALADDPALSFVEGSVNLTGSAASVGWFDSHDFGTGMLSSGVFLTSGSNMPGTSNTDTGFGDGRGEDGDARLDAIVASVFSGNYQTNDATIFAFDIVVDDPAATSITFDVVFGSEEFPEYVDSYVDIGAVFVNGVNHAYFNDNLSRPLSVVSQNLDSGYFRDNTSGAYPTEFDGLSNVLTISAPVVQGVNTIEIAVADTGDFVLDSGIAVANIRTGEFFGGGTKLFVAPAGSNKGNNVLISSAPLLDEYFETGAGNDYVSAKGGNDIISLGDGDDEAWGGDGDDQFDGGDGNDTLNGEGGNDWFVAASGAGDDHYDGGADEDTITFFSATKSIQVDLGKGIASGEEIGNDTLADIERVLAGQGDDLLRGSLRDEWLDGGAGKDRIAGLGGADTLRGGDGADRLSGGAGDDTLAGGMGNDTLDGGKGFDIADFSEATGPIRVNLAGRKPQDTGEGRDRLIGIEGVQSGAGDDRLIGDNRANVLISGDGNDLLNGKGGNDLLDGGLGDDRLIGGKGLDTAGFTSGNDVAVTLETGKAQDTGEGLDILRGIENLVAGAGNDSLTGSKAGNLLDGGDGNDAIYGGGGNDVIIGGAGNDILAGQAGRDRFVFKEGFGEDVVLDFDVRKAGDRLDLRGTVDGLDDLTIASVNGGADTLITVVTTGDTILLVGVSEDSLNASFSFLI